MKLLVLPIILVMTICSCGSSEDDFTKKENQEKKTKEELAEHNEKIVLLARIKGTSYDTLFLILTEYYSITSEYENSSDSLRFYSEKAIDIISRKYHISKLRVATFVFSFKYEMISKEEVIEMESEKIDSEQEPQDH